MIIAIDGGIAALGWAVVQPKTARVIDFGVMTSEPDRAIAKSTDRARRIAKFGQQLTLVRSAHACTTIAAEGMLGHGTTNAVIPQALCWGMLVQLAIESGLELVEVIAKEWQHAVTPGRKKIEYSLVEKKLLELAGTRIIRIPKKLQTHALDAIGVGAYAALRPTTQITTRVGSRVS